MENPSEECRALLQQAEVYAEQQDHYHAVKLCKRAIRLSPGWLPPYLCLSQIYLKRREWKAVVHYNKKVVALDPSRQGNWWNLGLGAAATGRFRLARRVWRKFGLTDRRSFQKKPVVVQLQHSGMYELVWAQPLDPVRVALESIPHPASDRCYRDVVLIGREQVGTTVAGQHRLPVFAELDLLKRSHFQTWSCLLEEATSSDIQTLEELCRNAQLGMEIWSNANRSMRIPQQSEYHAQNWWSEDDETAFVAIAGRQEKPIREVLRSWSVITLKQWHDLKRHN